MTILRFVVSLAVLSGAITLAQTSPAPKTVKAVKFGKLWDKHMTQYTDETPGKPMLKQLVDNPPAVEVFLARKGAMRTLEAGVTTVRDLGSDHYEDIAMRNLINRGEMVGPRMFVCGYGLFITNTPYKPGLNPPAGGIADGIPEVLRAVRQQIAAGADVIKMFASTGTDDDVTQFETYSYDEIKAGVDAAHQFRKKIAIHSYGPDGASDAVRAGTDSLEHATDIDDATIQEMVKRGTFYVPTIDHNRYYLENWQKIGYNYLPTLRAEIALAITIHLRRSTVFRLLFRTNWAHRGGSRSIPCMCEEGVFGRASW